jgi:hypothetical protein
MSRTTSRARLNLQAGIRIRLVGVIPDGQQGCSWTSLRPKRERSDTVIALARPLGVPPRRQQEKPSFTQSGESKPQRRCWHNSGSSMNKLSAKDTTDIIAAAESSRCGGTRYVGNAGPHSVGSEPGSRATNSWATAAGRASEPDRTRASSGRIDNRTEPSDLLLLWPASRNS